MCSVSETHLPFVRPEDTEYFQVLEHVPQFLLLTEEHVPQFFMSFLHKGTGRWDCARPPCSNGLSSDLL